MVNIGTAPNTKSGDPIRTAFGKCNDNFSELYSNKIDIVTLKTIVANSTSFSDFQTKIAQL